MLMVLLPFLQFNLQGKSEQQMKDLEVKELKNGRVAMVGNSFFSLLIQS